MTHDDLERIFRECYPEANSRFAYGGGIIVATLLMLVVYLSLVARCAFWA